MTHFGAQHLCAIAREHHLITEGSLGLIAGSGAGHEAIHIQRELGCQVTAIDLNQIPEESNSGVHFVLGDIQAMPFAEGQFDFVFCYHVLEHLRDPESGVREIARVLRPGGLLYIGAPNRHRLVGYLGSYDASTREKIVWNAHDYWARLTGRFRNDYGEHAGFSKNELEALLGRHMSQIEWISVDYLRFKYRETIPAVLLRLLERPWLARFAAPALYALCWK